MDTFSQTSNTQIENENKILTSEKRDKSDALAEILKGLTINDARYYESDSSNANDAKGDPASDLNIATPTSDRKKRKVTDTSNGYLQQKLLSNWTLLIITTTINPRIDNRVAPCEAYPHKIATPQTMKIITDTACSSARVLRTPRRIRWTGRDVPTPSNCEIGVRSPRANYQVLIGFIDVSPASGHSGILWVFNKQQSTVSDEIKDTQKLDTSVDRNLAYDGDYASILRKVIGREISHSSSSDLYLCCQVNFLINAEDQQTRE